MRVKPEWAKGHNIGLEGAWVVEKFIGNQKAKFRFPGKCVQVGKVCTLSKNVKITFFDKPEMLLKNSIIS